MLTEKNSSGGGAWVRKTLTRLLEAAGAPIEHCQRTATVWQGSVCLIDALSADGALCPCLDEGNVYD